MADSDIDNPSPEPAQLRWLRRLVTVLTAVMIFGILTITGLLAYRLNRDPAPAFPQTLLLPAGQILTGVATSPDWSVLIGRDADGGQWVHLLAPDGETIHQSIRIRDSD